MSLKAIVLDMDGSVIRQGISGRFDVAWVSLRMLRDPLQFYAKKNAIKEFKRAISSQMTGNPVCWLLGSGDFHHLTLAFLEELREPFGLVVFDNHTDCSFMPPKYHCGNWLYHAAQLPLCKQIIHIGATAGYGTLEQQTGLSKLVNSGKIVALPGRNLSVTHCIETVRQVTGRENVKALPLYISIDKDVLAPSEAPGDWDNGSMSRIQLYEILQNIIRHKRLLGADICGELSGKWVIKTALIKDSMSRLEHPRHRLEPTGHSDTLNRETMERLLEILGVDHVDN